MNNTHVRVGPDTVWPGLSSLTDLEWDLRYGKEEDIIANRMLLASIVSAYSVLIKLPIRRRNEVCRAIKVAHKP